MSRRSIPKEITYIVGIDEAGRGPLAGPVSVGVFCVPVAFKKFKTFSAGVRDSKKLSEKKREEWFGKMEELKRANECFYAVAFGSAEMINTRGISYAIKHALKTALAKLHLPPEEALVLLDGGLYAPKEYPHQETIIHGDDKEAVISLASVLAKVTRDRHMLEIAKKHPAYGFHKHKGYGTKAHFSAIREHGILDIHRKGYLSNL